MKHGRQTQAFRGVAQRASTSSSVRSTRRPLQASWGQRIRYRMDTAFSRGPMAVIVWLASMTVSLILIASLVLAIFRVRINDESVGFVEAFWQSMLRVIDPGTMGGDNGWGLRVVALLVTVGGIFLASALIGIIAAAIDSKIQDLRRGRSFVVEHGHTLVLGWSPRIFTIVSEICVANENQSDSCIVVLADREKTEMEEELRSRVGARTRTRIVCRTGEPASLHDLAIVNVAHARSVVVLGEVEEPGGDAEIVKAVLAVLVAAGGDDRTIVAEVSDDEIATALGAAGDGRVLCVRASDIIARITAQACRQSGLSAVCQELLDFDGDEIYFHVEPALVGKTFGDALLAFEESSVIGIRFADGGVQVNPPMGTVLAADDAVIAVAADDDTVVFTGLREVDTPAVVVAPVKDPTPQRILVVGWNPIGAVVLDELDEFVPPGSAVDLLVDEDLATVDPGDLEALRNLTATVISTSSDMGRLEAQVDEHHYHHVIVLGYRGGLTESEGDARTLLTMLLLQRRAREAGHPPSRIVAEILDSRDVELAQATGADDFVVSDALSSYLMAQLAENPELDAVFTDLFDAEGSAIGVKPSEWCVSSGTSVEFAEVVAAARVRGETAIGYRRAPTGDAAAEVVVNPPKSATVTFAAGDAVVVVGKPE